ncbi:MAG: Fe-S cluster assembly ATPase SufC [Candidatus Neomarinimicrobiota bacterium]|jgi:Fe-S cluster assembly ATP-binding protein|nr:Fe-S cluster assembly ATPase SufC [Candidatus Neomarinimicrobiota bacterium]MEC9027477.1 Fe-S cluster assembly ATPase SufC [Candidatus Neomarinimicrobiota bacterium]MEC9105565.1 Fe-S cluster assembly ATPase SufC [Candidatus Neomarinimicrobiota bacterium]|tara:strand:- start:5808 stop:6548 length:741 start_codon:yes stop_codon:yes gene_type:complete
MLEINNLKASIDGKEILKGINLNVKSGEIHAIMGRNGSGKSTLANIIAGREAYQVTSGDILYNNISILNDTPEHRALEGIFMSFQYPVIIPGVNNTYFLKAALNAKRKHQGKPELDAAEFLDMIRKKLQIVGMEEKYLHRAVNDGFSGGEKKRNEILQMITLEPSLAILDETDSGLDIDALKIVAEGVNNYRQHDRAIIIITHYQRILRYLEADYVHVLIDGKIAKSGGEELAEALEEKGYGWLDN